MLQHPTVWFDWKQSKYPSKELLLYDFLHKRSWCIKDCDKERLQTTAFINVWKIFPGYTGHWFDVKTASTCTTDLWDALKSFILDSLKIKVAPHPIIVSLDTFMTKQDLTTDVYEAKMVRYSEFLAYALITQKTKIMYE